MGRCIGIDFDNTIVDYDEVFVAAARAGGLLPDGFCGGKIAVRDTIRRLPDGNDRWTELQARVYGRDIVRAVPFAGVADFLTRAAGSGATVYVVSHKSRYAAADRDGVDLRQAALAWLRANGLVSERGPLYPSSVFFETQRHEKIARITQLGCTDFIDDLIEVLEDPLFPPGVKTFHFVGKSAARSGFTSWGELERAIFDS